MKLEKKIAFYEKLKHPHDGLDELRVLFRYQKEEHRGVWVDISAVNRSQGYDISGYERTCALVKPLHRRSEPIRVAIANRVEGMMPKIRSMYERGLRGKITEFITTAVQDI